MTEKKRLTRADRAKLRRLEKSGKIKHRWGDKWDVEDALRVLASHKEARELASNQKGDHHGPDTD